MATHLTENDVLAMFLTPARPDSISRDIVDRGWEYDCEAAEYVPTVSLAECEEVASQFWAHFNALEEDGVLESAFGMFWLPR